MPDYTDKIKELEDQIKKTKYNKKTQHAIGLYKAQIAKLKEKEESRRSGGGGGKDTNFEVRKTGDGTVILIGFPSAGKSTLLNVLTDADSEVGAYAFTTLTCIPGVMQHKHAKIQILDVPGIVKGAASGRGRGREVLAAMRSADVCLILLDATRPAEYEVIIKEIYDTHIRLNKRKPNVRITKTGKDGIKIGATVKLTKLDEVTIKTVFREFKINNAEIIIRENIDVDQLIDVIEDNKKYMPSITVINKADLVTDEELKKIMKKFKGDLAISAQQKKGTDKVKDAIFKKLDLMRLYLKEPSKPADMEVPLIAFRNSNIKQICAKLHKDFVAKFRFARVWGKSAKFDGQKMIRTNHVLKDNDILEIHLR